MSENRALRIGVVGLGQCGGNFAAEFARKGYPAIAVNTSETDLRAVSGMEDAHRVYIGVEGLNGTGGNLQVGAGCLEKKSGDITDGMKALSGTEALIVVGGLGGGTGGNLAALVHLVATEERPVIAMGVLPASSDSHTAKVNALQGVNELLDAPFEALVMVDNQKLYSVFANAGIDQFLQEGNAAVVTSFDELNALSGQSDYASIRSFDPQEFRHTLLSGGMVVFGSRNIEETLSPESLMGCVGGILADHEHLCSGYELEDAVVVSTVLIGSSDAMADTPATVFQDFNNELKNDTGGAAHHAGIYSGKVDHPRLHVMVGGLPLPARTQELLEEAAQEAERFSSKKAPRTKLKKLDLSGLGALGKPPSSKGKGMVKSKGAAEQAVSEEEEPLVDLDFDDSDSLVVEEEVFSEEMISGDVDPFEEEEQL